MNKILLLHPPSGSWARDYISTLLHTVGLNAFQCLFKCGVSSLDPTPEICTIIIMGRDSYAKLGFNPSFDAIRGTGFLYRGIPCIVTYSTEDLRSQWTLYPVIVRDLQKAAKYFINKKLPEFNPILLTKLSLEATLNYINSIPPTALLSFDIETTRSPNIVTHMGLSYKNNCAISISFETFSDEEEKLIWDALDRVFSDPRIGKIGHNIQFDCSVLLWTHAIYVNNIYMDTMQAFHTCFLESASTGEDTMMGVKRKKQEGLSQGLGFVASFLLDIPAWKHLQEDKAKYNALDALITFKCAEVLKNLIQAYLVIPSFELERDSIEPAIFMALRGLKLNVEMKKALRDEFVQKLNTTELTLNNLIAPLGLDIKWSSPKQLKELLYDKLKLPTQSKINTKGIRVDSTDEKSLIALQMKVNHPIIDLILKYREYSKVLSTYLPEDTKSLFKTSYNITGTNTGRWSSSENILFTGDKNVTTGNLQNIPSRGEGKIVRKIFTAPSKPYLIQADYIQAEAVIVAYLCQDDGMKEIFNTGKDIHKITAALMYGIPIEEVTDKQREEGKTIRHAMGYCMGVGTLSIKLKCSRKKAQFLYDRFFQIHPRIRLWHQRIDIQLKKTRTLVTPLGRKRVFYDRLTEYSLKAAVAYVPQSIVGDLLNKSLVKFYNLYGEQYSPVMQLHDAFYVEGEECEISDIINKMRECMTWPIRIEGDICTLGVDFKVGKNWFEMNKWDEKNNCIIFK